jgi:hypothetical protein
MHLVGFNGFKGSGKNTSANILSEIYGDGTGVVYQVGFADKVKIAAALALGFLDASPRECIALMDEAKERWLIDYRTNDDVVQLGTITGRQYLQNIGVEMRKLFGEDFWVDQVLPRAAFGPYQGRRDVPYTEQEQNQSALSARYPDVDCLAITDLRFENEARRILELGGEVWRVNNPSCESDGHDSEQVLPDSCITYEIDNSGSINDLELEVERAMDTLS